MGDGGGSVGGRVGGVAGVAVAPPRDLHQLAALMHELEPERDYEIEPEGRNVAFTVHGQERCEEMLGCGALHDPDNLELTTALASVSRSSNVAVRVPTRSSFSASRQS